MQPTKNTGRLLGLLFAFSIILGVTGTINRGLSGLTFESTTVIQDLISKVSQMQWAILLDILGSAISIAISVFLYRYFASINRRLAVLYVIAALLSFGTIVTSNIFHWQLIALAQMAVQEDLLLMQRLYDNYYILHFLVLLIYSLANFILFYFMWLTKWIPRAVSIWGTLASVLVTYGAISNLLDVSPPFIVFAQNGIFMICFTLWLLIAGFKTSSQAVS